MSKDAELIDVQISTIQQNSFGIRSHNLVSLSDIGLSWASSDLRFSLPPSFQ